MAEHHDPPARPRTEDFLIYMVLAAPIFIVTFVIIALVVTIGVR